MTRLAASPLLRHFSLLSLGLASLAALSATTGCGRQAKKAAADTPRQITLHFKVESKLENLPKGKKFFVNDHDLRGATLLVNEREVGPIQAHSDSVYAVVTLPPEQLLFDRSVKLGLRLPTPCGKAIDLPLSAYSTNLDSPEAERAARKETYPTIDIRRDADLPSPIAIWVDDVGHESAKVEFGSVEVKGRVIPTDKAREVPGRHMLLWGSNCAPSHEVKIDGSLVGKATPQPDTRSYLIATEADACYERTVARYASAHDTTGGGSTDYPIARARVMPLKWEGFGYFLRKLPSGVEGQFSTTRSSLERVSCDGSRKSASQPGSQPHGPRKK